MDQMTQANAAMAEEAAAASQMLAHEAESISRLLARFNTGAAQPVPAQASAQPVPRKRAALQGVN